MQVDFGAPGPESEHSLHVPPHAHYDHTAPSPGGGGPGAPAYAPFRHPQQVPAIDPGLDQGPPTTHPRNGHAPMPSVHHQTPAHLLQPDNAHLSHATHHFYADMSRPSHTPPTPSTTSPRFSAISPHTSQPKQIAPPSYVPSDRAPPPRDVTDSTLDQAYASFILYCNPSFATTTDTSELTKLFRIPPKSDGKEAFSTWRLFELIGKFDRKEIKTWTQLAMDLGVEAPDIEKGQSTQKVQQYSVRLKRWMRAMHVDAFFEYLLGKQPPYYMQIPPPHAPFPEGGRDGVPLEEDLAIRALDPKFRPKRGRRKADDGDDDVDMSDNTPSRKRPQLDTSIPFGNVLQPQSAYPNSAHPDHMEGFLSSHDPWTASTITPSSAMTSASAPGRMNPNKTLTPYSASPMSGQTAQQLRWRLNTHDNPTTPHPLSAVTPQSAHAAFFDEPQSAVTPSTSRGRSRRRHGPAVSSAWSSNNTTPSGKLRGRPPSNRSVRDGPFVTFPANPKTREAPTIDMNRTPGNLTPIIERAQSDPPASDQHFRFPPTPASAISPSTMNAGLQKPHRLSLQVPQSVGNPVRLVTPTVLVNGEQDPQPPATLAPSAIPAESHTSSLNPAPTTAPSSNIHHPSTQPPSTTLDLPVIPLDTLNRALAADLLRAPLSGRKKRLRGSEAKSLASAILHPLFPPSSPHQPILSIAIATSLGLGAAVGFGPGVPTGGVKRIDVTRFRVGGDGYESPVDEDDEGDVSGAGAAAAGTVKESFDVMFGVAMGALVGDWGVKGLELGAADEEEGGVEGGGGGEHVGGNGAEDWKRRFEVVSQRLEEERERGRGLRERVLEVVL